MEIPAKFDSCIWCGHPFAIKGFRVRPGQVERSKEHIIPENIFGRLKTEDVCVLCNSKFGNEVDNRLLKNGHILTAGLAAGFKPEQLLPQFRASGTTPQGDPFEFVVKNGKWRLTPSFSPTGFRIGSVNGSTSKEDLQNAKKKMLKLALSEKSLGLSVSEARQWVDTLFADLPNQQAEYAVYNERIKQGVRTRPFQAIGVIKTTSHPWQTQWAIAKVAYETAHVLLPEKLRRKIFTALTQLKQFIEARKERQGLFSHRTLKIKAVPRHEIEIAVGGDKLKFCVRIFGREQWRLTFDVLQDDRPARLDKYRLLVVNDCCITKGSTVRISENVPELQERGQEKAK